MERLNYQHLLYFWTVTKQGSITAACEVLHLSQPTISAQLAVFEQAVGTQLMRKEGRKLVLTDTGKMIFGYADEIFTLGRELTQLLKGRGSEHGLRLNIGITDALPKLIAFRLLDPLLNLPKPIQIYCYEDKTDRLLTEIALHNIDMVLADEPAAPASGARIFNHYLGESAVGVFAAPELAKRYQRDFPKCLNGAPFLLPTPNTALRRSLNQWFNTYDVSPNIKAEIEDSALLKKFGSAGTGLFFSAIAVADDIQQQYGTILLGKLDSVHERFYAITAQRKIKHQAVVTILEKAQQKLFGILEGPSYQGVNE